MRALVLDGGFGLENLNVIEREKPQPGPGEVLVKVAAVSLNYRDLLLVEGAYNPRQKMPVVPTSDGAGIVAAVGPGVTRFAPGDRVVNGIAEGWIGGAPDAVGLKTIRGGPGGDGFCADYVLVPEHALFAVPDHLSLTEAATLPCAGITAWCAVIEHGNVRPGGTVVVEGTGGVALFAMQFARIAGARTMVLSSSNEKLDRISSLGADVTANYVEVPEWSRAVRDRLDADGADLVVELGGAATLENALRSVKPGGTVALIGNLSGSHAPLNLPLAVMRQVRLQGITCGSLGDMSRMMAAVETHGLKPWVHETFPLERHRDAFELMRAGGHVGKIVIALDTEG